MIDFFFDIDGTLLPFGKPIPESTVKAIERIRSLGHRAFLATGRSLKEVGDDILALGFDGGVYAGGAVAYIGDKKILDRTFSKTEWDRVSSFCRSRGYRMLVQTEEGTYLSEETRSYWYSLLLKHVGRIVAVSSMIVSSVIPDDARITKILYISPDSSIEEIRSSLSPFFTVIDNTVGLPPDLMGEIVLPGVSKLSGIETIENSLETRAFTVAVGDGANDIEMICGSDLGIAMGNASQMLKKAADYITTNVEEDVIFNAVEYVIDYCKKN